MRVALAEDGALFREGLVMLLQAAGHEVVGCTADGDSLVELLAKEPADVAILDIRMPPEPDGGLVTAERLRAAHPEMGLLFLSHYAESHYLMRILQIGTESIGYRLKEKVGSVDVLSDTLTRISGGEIVIEPVLAKRLVERPRGEREGRHLHAVRARARRAAPDGRGTVEQRHRRAAVRHAEGRREAHRQHLRQARTCTPTPRSTTAGCSPCSPTCARSATATDRIRCAALARPPDWPSSPWRIA